jgi:ABC-type multidrug transport system ATPase subunit
MSQEILKALMQLFAIISKQDDGINDIKKEFVKSFLISTLNEEKVNEYYNLFEDFLIDKKKNQLDLEQGVEKKETRTSVNDSVKMLGICKRIGKDLTQEQKIIVLVRLFELVNSDRIFSKNRIGIIETVAKVFKIKGREYSSIEQFVLSDNIASQSKEDVLYLTGDRIGDDDFKSIYYPGLNGNLFILQVAKVNLYFLRFTGDIKVHLNGNFLPGNRIYLMATGSVLRLTVGKPLYYSEIISRFIDRPDDISISFEAKNIEYKFPNGNIGLRGINVSEREGNLVGIMGASGAGKTTLLNILSGIERPSSGSVLINEENLHGKNKNLDGVIGFVPQDDLLFEELTVFENLYFNAKICFKNLSNKELEEIVLSVLSNLGLLHTKDLKVGNVMNKTISGGQRKRLNIALELIREPSILFLDEPTSGLSSKDSENVLDLLRELSFKGKLIFVVIHQPSSDVYKMFDKIVLLDTGGYQVYYGNPVEAVSYFKQIDQQVNSDAGECSFCGTVNPETMFNVIESKEVDEYGNLSEKRKINPKIWANLYQDKFKNIEIKTVTSPPPKSLNLRNRFQQFLIFFKRDLLSKISNKQYLLINLLEAPVLAFFLSFVVRYVTNPETGTYTYRDNENIAPYIFMSIVVAMFIGLTVSAEEIFKDRLIRKREEFLNLSRFSYLTSKAVLLFILSAIQTLTFVVVGNYVLELRGMNLSFWIMLFSISCIANIIGLIISSSFNSAVTIYIIIPLLIIPQMILGGAMFSYDKLNYMIGGGMTKDVPLIADFMPARWGYEGLVVDTYVNNEYGKAFYEIERKESICSYKQSYYIPLLKDLLYEANTGMKSPMGLKQGQVIINLMILKNEIIKENKINPSIPFENPDRLKISNLDPELIQEIEDYLLKVNTFYSLIYNAVTMRKEIVNAGMNEKDLGILRHLKSNYYNNNLNEILTNSMLKKRIIINQEFDVMQKVDPIYLFPSKSNYFDFKTHFYVPKKHIFGRLIETYWFNIIILWSYTLLLFLALYFNLLKKLLSISSLFIIKNKK